MKTFKVLGISLVCLALLSACQAAPSSSMASSSMASSGMSSSATASGADAMMDDSMSGSAMAGDSMGSSSETPAGYHKITAEEAKKMMDAGGVTIIDVRTQKEFDDGHIQGAILIPSDTIGGKPLTDVLPDLNATLLVYCRSGRRSRAASLSLAEMGYTQVYDFGGIIDWPYEIVKS